MLEKLTAIVPGAAIVLMARLAPADPVVTAPPAAASSSLATPAPATSAPVTPPPGTPAPYPPAPVYNIYMMAPPAALPSGDHLHEGFLLRMALGFGYFHDSAKVRSAGIGADATISAAGLAAEISMGGSLSPGFVLGGALLSETGISPTIHYEDGSPPSNARANAFVLGPFLDYYTRPSGGLHFGGTIGYATMTVRDKASPIDSAQVKGLGVVPEVGYEWWVGSEWGMGGLFRLFIVGAKRTAKDVTETDTCVAPSLLFTATYN